MCRFFRGTPQKELAFLPIHITPTGVQAPEKCLFSGHSPKKSWHSLCPIYITPTKVLNSRKEKKRNRPKWSLKLRLQRRPGRCCAGQRPQTPTCQTNEKLSRHFSALPWRLDSCLKLGSLHVSYISANLSTATDHNELVCAFLFLTSTASISGSEPRTSPERSSLCSTHAERSIISMSVSAERRPHCPDRTSVDGDN